MMSFARVAGVGSGQGSSVSISRDRRGASMATDSGADPGAPGGREVELALKEVQLILRDSLTERGVDHWLGTPNRMLGGRRPRDVLREGQVEMVRKAAAAFVDGAYI